ncbi:MAG: LysR family transcriptional regulator [Myxococcales bacterium]|nr:LysR family transcriptional regulator [Myxococcales bacterium]USN51598.1 MAG: LysR family transcriptional regulator [Myxococcales bacterium]
MMANINLNLLRIFQAVYEDQNMTQAAKKLFLTQSGVSQHIKNLEETLNLILFDRVGKSLIPTRNAHSLYEQCKNSLDSLQLTIEQLSGSTPCGAISISAPPEFANSVLIPVLVKLKKIYPAIVIHLHVGMASQMTKKLLSGEQDIAFLDGVISDTRLETTLVYDERILLCCKRSLLKKYPLSPKKHLHNELPLLAYLPGEPIFQKWYRHHFGQTPTRLNISSYLSSSQNVARMICHGMGAGIISGNHFSELKKLGHDLVEISINKQALINPISMNRIKYRSSTFIENAVFKFLLMHLNEAL